MGENPTRVESYIGLGALSSKTRYNLVYKALERRIGYSLKVQEEQEQPKQSSVQSQN